MSVGIIVLLTAAALGLLLIWVALPERRPICPRCSCRRPLIPVGDVYVCEACAHELLDAPVLPPGGSL